MRGDKKCERLELRLTTEEFATLRGAAKREGVSVTELARSSVMQRAAAAVAREEAQVDATEAAWTGPNEEWF